MLNARKGKIKYRWATYKICRQVFFSPTSRSNQESEGFFFQQATYKGTYVEAVESARAGLSPKKGGREKEKKRNEKKRRRPRKVVCRHKKGTWEWRKEKDHGRQEGGSAKARLRVPSTKNFFFWFTSIWVWKWPVLFEVSAPTRLSLRGSHVQRKFQKRTTIRSKSSTLKGLLYPGWRSRCKAFVVRKGRTIALEQSMSKKAVIWQATINPFFHELGILGDSYLSCTA